MTNTNYPKAIRRCKPTRVYLLPALLACSAATWANTDSSPTSVPDFDSQLPVLGGDIPEVLTTTRLRQPKTRVPGSTTVIEGETIRDLGLMHLYEVFRLVPGMTVNFVGSHQPSVTYHGTSHYEQRRMQVLVDGRTAHRVTLSDMDWKTMPVPLEMIERIEVARGPNSAAYGINAFLGSINIITRDPADTAGVETYVGSGSRGYRRAFGSVGGTGEAMDWRLNYEKRRFDGFDTNDDGEDFHDGKDINSFNWDSRLYLDNNANLELRAGVVDGVDERDQDKGGSLEANENPDIDLRDYHLQAKLNYQLSKDHFFHVQAAVENYKRRQDYGIAWGQAAVDCLDNGTALYAEDSQGDDICFPDGETDAFFADISDSYEDTRIELELQDTLLFSEDLKLVTGTGFRKDILRSDTFFNGREEIYQSRVFGNLEYSPWRWLTFNAGGNWERTSTTGEDYFSPRVAANFQLTDQQALRFVFSQAVRTPDAFEQDSDYGYTLRNVRPAEYADLEDTRITIDEAGDTGLDTSDKELEEERITSYEISYFIQHAMDEALLSLEVRGFKDRMRDMIGGIIQLKEWSLENEYNIDQKGVEVEGSAEFPGTTLRASYAYLDQDTWYTGILSDESDTLERMSVRHSGSLAVIQDLRWNLKGATAFYWADEFNRKQEQFERIDVRLSKQFFAPRYNAELAFVMQHYLNREVELSSDNIIEDHNQYFIEASLKF